MAPAPPGGEPWKAQLAVQCVVLGSMIVGPAAAHHSPAAFDQTKEVRIEGTLTKFSYYNPHTF